MSKFPLVIVLALVAGPAWADYVCPANSNVCSYSVNASSGKVGLGGASADGKEWITAPDDKYFVNATLTAHYSGFILSVSSRGPTAFGRGKFLPET